MSMLTGIYEIDQAQLKKLMRFTIDAGTNLLTFGAAGTGKTEMGVQAIREKGYKPLYLNLSVLEAPDLVGVPVVDEATLTSHHAVPGNFPIRYTDEEWERILDKHKASQAAALKTAQAVAQEAENDLAKREGRKPRTLTGTPDGFKPVPPPKRPEEVVLLVDELDKAAPELQNPMLELFQFRTINGRPLAIKAVIATGNLPDEGAFSRPVSHALTNRCSVYKVSTAFEPWQEWAASAHVNPLVVGFLSRNTEMLLQPPPEGDDTAYCHPSPRAWTLAARDLDQAGREAPVEFQELLIAARVGCPVATKFKVWLEHYRHIEPLIDKLVKDGTPPSFEKGEDTLDRVLVCAIAGVDAIMRVCREKPTDKKAQDVQQKRIAQYTENVMRWMKELPGEICIGAMKSTFTMEEIKRHKLTQYPDFMKAFIKVRKAMQADA